MSKENYTRTSWRIRYNEREDPVRLICHGNDDITDLKVFNYVRNTPIVLAPIGRTSVLVLSEHKDDKGKRGLKIHDLRQVDDEFVNSFTFILKGDELRLSKLKLDLSRVADTDRCVGVSYFLRKLFNHGFNVILAPKTLRSKPSSTLRAAIAVSKHGMEQGDADVR